MSSFVSMIFGENKEEEKKQEERKEDVFSSDDDSDLSLIEFSEADSFARRSGSIDEFSEVGEMSFIQNVEKNEEEKKCEEKIDEIPSTDDDSDLERISLLDDSFKISGSISDVSDLSFIQNELLMKDIVKEESEKTELVSDRMAKFRELMDRDTQSFAIRLMGMLNEGID